MADEEDQGQGEAPTPPAPRPDPYAQFGNPLHDTWGTQKPPPQPTYTTVEPVRPRARSSALKWVVGLAVVALVGFGFWLAREPLGDAWESATDAVSGDSDDEEPFEAAAEAQTEEFEAWADENSERLQSLGEATLAAGTALEDYVNQAQALGDFDPAIAESTLMTLRTVLVANAQLLDEAPESEIRSDFLNALLVGVDGVSQMIDALGAEQGSDYDAAADRMSQSADEIERLCRQYGSSAAGLC